MLVVVDAHHNFDDVRCLLPLLYYDMNKLRPAHSKSIQQIVTAVKTATSILMIFMNQAMNYKPCKKLGPCRGYCVEMRVE